MGRIQESPTLAITAKALKLKSEGKDIIGLAAGEPDFDTPDFIKNAAIEAIQAGFTKYTAATGTPSLKQLGEILFDKLELPGGKKGKTGAYGTGVDVLEDLA